MGTRKILRVWIPIGRGLDSRRKIPTKIRCHGVLGKRGIFTDDNAEELVLRIRLLKAAACVWEDRWWFHIFLIFTLLGEDSHSD